MNNCLKNLLLMAALCLFAGAASLLAANPPVNTQTVSYPSGNETVSGYLALPDGGGKHPAVIAIHEWWGLNDQVKEEARKFAAQGYVVLAVDLYRGKVATTPDEAHEIMRGVPEDRATRDLLAATAYLRSQKNVDPKP